MLYCPEVIHKFCYYIGNCSGPLSLAHLYLSFEIHNIKAGNPHKKPKTYSEIILHIFFSYQKMSYCLVVTITTEKHPQHMYLCMYVY